MTTINGTKFLCDMPPGDAPWRLKSFDGKVYAASPSAGLFWLEIIVDKLAPDGWRAQWVQVSITEDCVITSHVWEATR